MKDVAPMSQGGDRAVRDSEPLINHPEMTQLFADQSTLTKGLSASDSTKGENKSESLEFNTINLYDMKTISTGLSVLDSGDKLSPKPGEHSVHAKEQSEVVVGSGESLDSISKDFFGPDATRSQVEMFKRAVETINRTGPEDFSVLPGQALKLPGLSDAGKLFHYEDGSYSTWSPEDKEITTLDKNKDFSIERGDGSKKIYFANGGSVETKDGVSTHNRKDGVSVQYREDGTTTTTRDGLKISRDDHGALLEIEGAVPAVNAKGQRYDKSADGHGGTVERVFGDTRADKFALVTSRDGEMEVFAKGADGKDMVSKASGDPSVRFAREELLAKADLSISDPVELARFKADIVRFESRSQSQGLKPSQIEDTYTEVGRLLRTPGFHNSQKERTDLARQVMSHAAEPTSINQGVHNTCTIASLEVNIYSKRPEKAAALVAQVGVNGTFQDKEGRLVSLSRGNLLPDNEASKPKQLNGERDYASQLFQVTAINSLYNADHTLPLTYEKVAPDSEKDQGEREALFGISFKEQFDGFNFDQAARLHLLITGERDPELAIPATFRSADKLGEFLKAKSVNGGFPSMIIVHTGNPPFGSKDGGWHAINVTGYDPVKKTVTLDNQWGEAKDHIASPVGLQDAWKATQNPHIKRASR